MEIKRKGGIYLPKVVRLRRQIIICLRPAPTAHLRSRGAEEGPYCVVSLEGAMDKG